jgi:hypothetical protein
MSSFEKQSELLDNDLIRLQNENELLQIELDGLLKEPNQLNKFKQDVYNYESDLQKLKTWKVDFSRHLLFSLLFVQKDSSFTTN